MDVPKAPAMRPYGRHILIWENGDCADPEAALRLHRRFAELARAHGLSKLRNPERVKCTLTGCLGVCGGGPIVAVYPDGIWYHHVDEAALERIVNEHILGDQPVDELIFHRPGSKGAAPGGEQIAYTPDHSDEVRRPGDHGTGSQSEPARRKGAEATSPVEVAGAGTQLHSTPEALARRKTARAERRQKGLVIVNTGNGKGKTTAALGIVLRAWGRDLRIGGVQFFKHENANFGELRALQKIGVTLTPMGDGFTWTSRDMDETQAKALSGWELAKRRIAGGESDIFLLDEFTYLLHFGWLDTAEAIAWIAEHKPPLLHLVITGRDAPAELIAFADLVTDMREIKHPLREQGIRAQKGIEF
jgi:cob(I)alamin adenosyltransferase